MLNIIVVVVDIEHGVDTDPVLVSMLVCPAGLRRKLEEYEKKAKYQIAEAIADTADTSEEIKVQLVLQFGVSRDCSEVLLALRGRVYLPMIVSKFGPKTWPRCRDRETRMISTQIQTVRELVAAVQLVD